MRFIYKLSINGQPSFEHEARGVVSQSEGEEQCRRIYGDSVVICGFRTEST